MKKYFFGLAVFLIITVGFFFPASLQAQNDKCDKGFEEISGVCFPTETGLSDASVEEIINNFMLWILGIFGMICIIGFVISGIQYLTSAGEEKQIETAKRNMKWSLVGVIVGLSGLVILWAVELALKASRYF